MGIILRKDKAEKLTILELDNNFEYLAMDSNDIDLFLRRDQYDVVSDSLYINNQNDGLWYPKTFTTRVGKLGISIRNYDLIRDYNPEIVIERYKKASGKVRTYLEGNKDIKIKVESVGNFKLTDPYSDYVIASEMSIIDPNKVSMYRPMVIPITASSSYYTITAENYFSQKSPPRVSGSKKCFYRESGVDTLIYDDTEVCSLLVKSRRIGISNCRIRIRISDGFGGYKYSKPLKDLKIKMILSLEATAWLEETIPGNIFSNITYDLT